MTGITIEPPHFGVTGSECGITATMRPGTYWDAVQPLDAPEYIARGSLLAGRLVIDGKRYVTTTEAMHDRMFGSLS